MNIYHCTYQLGNNPLKTEVIQVEGDTLNEVYLSTLERLTVRAKKQKQRIRFMEVVCQESGERMFFGDEPKMSKKFKGTIIPEQFQMSQKLELPTANFLKTVDEFTKLMEEAAPYSAEANEQTPFLYFLSYSRDHPCETGRVVAAIPFKINSELKISICERILADIVDCSVENVVLTNFVLLNEWQED